jgi:hypothetical protein
MFKETDVAWLAGLLEGEGAFSLGPPSKPTQSRIQLSTTDEDIAARVATMFGVRYHQITHRTNTGVRSTKPMFVLQVRGSTAVIWMRRVLPYMGARRTQQIETAIAGYTPKTVRYNRVTYLSELHQPKTQGTGI